METVKFFMKVVVSAGVALSTAAGAGVLNNSRVEEVMTRASLAVREAVVEMSQIAEVHLAGETGTHLEAQVESGSSAQVEAQPEVEAETGVTADTEAALETEISGAVESEDIETIGVSAESETETDAGLTVGLDNLLSGTLNLTGGISLGDD